MRPALVLTVFAATSLAARAEPAPIRLTRDQVAAATKAAQAKLPPVDKAKQAQCQKLLEAYNAHPSAPQQLVAAGTCFRSAGALGAALMMWRNVVKEYLKTPEATDAQRELGLAYEAAGFYDKAAEEYERYARLFGGEPDAREQLVRATCIWEQLGGDDQARTDLRYLTKTWPRIELDAVHLCDAVRPIQPPAP